MLQTCNPCTLGPEASAGYHHPQLYSEFTVSLGYRGTYDKKK